MNRGKMKVGGILLALCLALSLSTVAFASSAQAPGAASETVENSDAVVFIAQMGEQMFSTLQDAVDAVPDSGEQAVITLLGDTTGGGVVVKAGQNIVFDFGGYTYTIGNEGLVGSSDRKTIGFQLLKGATVTMQNGTVDAEETCERVVQNYCDLTLDNLTVDASKNEYCKYVMSHNNGTLQLLGNTSILAAEGNVAFDVFYWPNGGYEEDVSAVVDTTGTIQGNIEYGSDGSDIGMSNVADKAKLTILNGTVTGSIKTGGLGEEEANILIGGGNFTSETNQNVSKYRAIAAMDGMLYRMLQDAVDAVPDSGEQAVITLLGDTTGGGVVVKAGQNIVFDFGGYTYTIGNEGLVGSSDRKTIGFQLLKGATVTMQNGTVDAGETCERVVQNYCDLTLDNLTVDASKNEYCKYVMSHNNGTLQLLGNTSILAAEGNVAFDVFYWPDGGYGAVSAVVNTTGVIQGNIEYGSDGSDIGMSNVADKAKLTILNGTVTGSIKTGGLGAEKANIQIEGGAFTKVPDDYLSADATTTHKNMAGASVIHTGASLTEVPYKAPTTSAAGNKQHWSCNACGQVFADAQGEQPVNDADVVLAKLPTSSKPDSTPTTPEVEVTVTPSVSDTTSDTTTQTPVSSSTVRPSTVRPASGSVATVETDEEDIEEEAVPLAPEATESGENTEQAPAETTPDVADTTGATDSDASASSFVKLALLAFGALVILGGVVLFFERKKHSNG